MPNITSVGLTNGLGTSGTGTISTLDNLIGTAGTASAQVQTVQGIASMTPLKVDGSAVTQPVSGTVSVNALPSGTNTIGSVKITDGTNTVTVNNNGRAAPSGSAPVVLAKQNYQAVAASSSATVLGTTGAVGDWLDFILIVPATTAAGAVSITDGSGSAMTVWAGGGTTALVSLVPFAVPVRAVTTSGAWKVTTGTNVSVIASGNFT